MRFRIPLMAAALCVGVLTDATAQAPDTTLPASFRNPMPLYAKGLGALSWKINTTSKEAQAFFDQGLQLLYSFTPEDAARSFREAQQRDPNCAMCYFGEAWAWGPYLNGPMQARNAPRAYAAIQKAVKLRERASDLEKALIDAMAIRFRPTYDSVTHARLAREYSDAMARLYERHPHQMEVGTLYAESLMLLEPRRGTWDVQRPAVRRIHEVLETLLAHDVNHPGACHLLIHATESTVRPAAAERCANLLGQSIPGASHINHMPSHTFNRIGRWGDAVRANIEAWHSDLRAAYGEGFAIYPSHNLHMLLFSASYDGQGAVAIQAARDYTKIDRGGTFYQALTMLRFGRFDELLEVRQPPPNNPILVGLWQFARGYAQLRHERADSARVYLEKVDSGAKAIPANVSFRGHNAASLLGVAGGILRAELLRKEGRAAEALPVLERAVALEDSLRYDEPEPLNFAARQWLGALLLELNRAADAERVYRAELEDHPHNGWSLYGLEQALRAQGKSREAEQVHEQFVKAWSRSDTLIRGSRF
jgi:tetratricopeptide (TPR) repeat protein